MNNDSFISICYLNKLLEVFSLYYFLNILISVNKNNLELYEGQLFGRKNKFKDLK